VQKPQDKAAAKAQRQTMKNVQGKSASDVISHDRIDKSISEAYDHESIKIPEPKIEEPESDKEEENSKKSKRKGRKDKDKDSKKELKKSKSGRSKLNFDSSEDEEKIESEKEPSDEESESNGSDHVDDMLVHMYYKNEEILRTKKIQNHDPFENIMKAKVEAINDGDLLKSKTQFNIRDFAPKCEH